jgi:hypothetical protein
MASDSLPEQIQRNGYLTLSRRCCGFVEKRQNALETPLDTWERPVAN